MLRVVAFVAAMACCVRSRSCICSSIGAVRQSSTQTPRAVAAAGDDPTPPMFIMSGVPGVADDVQTLFPQNVTATFACRCTPDPPRRAQYLVSVTSLGPCITESVLKSTCDVLKRLGIMRCTEIWSAGFAGEADPASADSGVLVETTRRVCRNLTGACALDASYLAAVDSALPILG